MGYPFGLQRMSMLTVDVSGTNVLSYVNMPKRLSSLFNEDLAIMERQSAFANRLELYRSTQDEIDAVAWSKIRSIELCRLIERIDSYIEWSWRVSLCLSNLHSEKLWLGVCPRFIRIAKGGLNYCLGFRIANWGAMRGVEVWYYWKFIRTTRLGRYARNL
ncbi:hypothetical protein V8G54_011083 [Vigna mungo]|uniref:Uncharacterized protein n=1 Tax=Vigna mungo TaxID=3915 RepID=A0AAQ3S0V4_VIGMU